MPVFTDHIKLAVPYPRNPIATGSFPPDCWLDPPIRRSESQRFHVSNVLDVFEKFDLHVPNGEIIQVIRVPPNPSGSVSKPMETPVLFTSK